MMDSVPAGSATETPRFAITPLRPALAKMLSPRLLNRRPASRAHRLMIDIADWVGASPYSALMDRAGPYRRVAVAMPVLIVALSVMAVDNLAAGARDPARWLPHLLLAASLGWALYSLLRTGRLVDQAGIPHPALFAIGASLLGWVAIWFGAPSPACCSLPVMAFGTGLMVGAAALFAGAERQSTRPAMIGGRLLLSAGALVLGLSVLVGVSVEIVTGTVHHLAHDFGLSMLGSALVSLAIAEARLAFRLLGYGVRRAR